MIEESDSEGDDSFGPPARSVEVKIESPTEDELKDIIGGELLNEKKEKLFSNDLDVVVAHRKERLRNVVGPQIVGARDKIHGIFDTCYSPAVIENEPDLQPGAEDLRVAGELDNVIEKLAKDIYDIADRQFEEQASSVINANSKELSDQQKKIDILEEKQKTDKLAVDRMSQKVKRRTILLSQQRTAFLRELLVLKEQLFQRSRLGQEFSPDAMNLFDSSKFASLTSSIDQGDEDADEEDGETEEMFSKKTVQKMMENIKKKFDDDKKRTAINQKQLMQHKDMEMTKLRTQIGDLNRDVLEANETIGILRDKYDEVGALHEQEKSEMEVSHVKELEELEAKLKREAPEPVVVTERDDAGDLMVERLMMSVEDTQYVMLPDGDTESSSDIGDENAPVTSESKRKKDKTDKFAAYKEMLEEKEQDIQNLEDLNARLLEQVEELKTSKEDTDVDDISNKKIADLEAALEEVTVDRDRLQDLTANQAVRMAVEVPPLDLSRASPVADVPSSRYDPTSARSETASHKDLIEEIEKLRARVAELEAGNSELQELKQVLDPQGLEKLKDAVDKNNELKRERSAVNWQLLVASYQAERIQTARRESLTAQSVESARLNNEGMERTESQRQMAAIRTLNVFERLEARAQQMVEKLRKTRGLLVAERRNNAERVLNSACLLVRPGLEMRAARIFRTTTPGTGSRRKARPSSGSPSIPSSRARPRSARIPKLPTGFAPSPGGRAQTSIGSPRTQVYQGSSLAMRPVHSSPRLHGGEARTTPKTTPRKGRRTPRSRQNSPRYASPRSAKQSPRPSLNVENVRPGLIRAVATGEGTSYEVMAAESPSYIRATSDPKPHQISAEADKYVSEQATDSTVRGFYDVTSSPMEARATSSQAERLSMLVSEEGAYQAGR